MLVFSAIATASQKQYTNTKRIRNHNMTENIHTIRKRSGHMEIFDPEKIRRAITRAFSSTGESVTDAQLNDMTGSVSYTHLTLPTNSLV